MTNLKLKKNRAYLLKNINKEDAAMMKYYRERLKLKQLQAKFYLRQQMNARGLRKHKTKAAFIAMNKRPSSNQTSHKIKGLYLSLIHI